MQLTAENRRMECRSDVFRPIVAVKGPDVRIAIFVDIDDADEVHRECVAVLGGPFEHTADELSVLVSGLYSCGPVLQYTLVISTSASS